MMSMAEDEEDIEPSIKQVCMKSNVHCCYLIVDILERAHYAVVGRNILLCIM